VDHTDLRSARKHNKLDNLLQTTSPSEGSLLEYYMVWHHRNILTFRTNQLPQSSEQNKSSTVRIKTEVAGFSDMPVEYHHTKRLHITENRDILYTALSTTDLVRLINILLFSSNNNYLSYNSCSSTMSKSDHTYTYLFSCLYESLQHNPILQKPKRLPHTQGKECLANYFRNLHVWGCVSKLAFHYTCARTHTHTNNKNNTFHNITTYVLLVFKVFSKF
jgi:hypothetical protein